MREAIILPCMLFGPNDATQVPGRTFVSVSQWLHHVQCKPVQTRSGALKSEALFISRQTPFSAARKHLK